MKITRIGIVSKINSREAVDIGTKVASYLESNGLEVVYSGEIAKKAGAESVLPENLNADMVVVVGGDGTILRTVQNVGQTPVLGIKVGVLGFLCETSPELWKDAIDRVISNRFYLEFRTKLKPSHNGISCPEVLNEVLVTTAKPSKILSLSVSKDSEPLLRGKADGVMVSTTTGSTAYALSAGGPIIDPQLDAMQVTFICPLATGLRPTLIPTSSRVEIEVNAGWSSAICVLDGQSSFGVKAGEPVVIERSSKPAVFVRLGKSNFYKRISEKVKQGFEV